MIHYECISDVDLTFDADTSIKTWYADGIASFAERPFQARVTTHRKRKNRINEDKTTKVGTYV